VTSQFLNFSVLSFICILKYIKCSHEKGLLYGHNNHNKIICYSDVDWTEFLSDRRSTSRYYVLIGDNLIS